MRGLLEKIKNYVVYDADREFYARVFPDSVSRADLFRIRTMTHGDLPSVMEIENQNYEFPWAEDIFTDCFRASYHCDLPATRPAFDPTCGTVYALGPMKHVLGPTGTWLAPLALAALPRALQDAAAGAVQEQPGAGQVLELSLEQALDIALGNDLGLQIEELASEGARFGAEGSWGAFDPVLTATGSVFDAEFEASSAFSGTSVIEENTLSAGAGLDLPLTTGGSFAFTFDLANSESNNSLAQGIDTATTDVFAIEFRQPLLRGFGSSYATSSRSITSSRRFCGAHEIPRR